MKHFKSFKNLNGRSKEMMQLSESSLTTEEMIPVCLVYLKKIGVEDVQYIQSETSDPDLITFSCWGIASSQREHTKSQMPTFGPYLTKEEAEKTLKKLTNLVENEDADFLKSLSDYDYYVTQDLRRIDTVDGRSFRLEKLTVNFSNLYGENLKKLYQQAVKYLGARRAFNVQKSSKFSL